MPTSALRKLEAGLSLPQRWAIARARAERAVARVRDFDPSQPRDEHGRWSDTGAGEKPSGSEKPAKGALGIPGLPADITVKFPMLEHAVARDAFDITAELRP